MLKNISMGGTGSPPLGMLDGPEEMMAIVTRDNARKYCNLQLRTDGILIRLNYLTQVWAAGIPYREIVGVHLIPNTKSSNRFDAYTITLKLMKPCPLMFSIAPEFRQGIISFFGKAKLPVVQYLTPTKILIE